ncbi:hypothetical protein QAD02_017445 [Eretmocerus hayati]|uniref:Uncharacterized protein n=1 Tax=Eretmocerus hayati TaxID=131215 RepID=A0ACC2PDW7_9HYME|nr:hypothetical protein QAD02_017445 [Eretmocerus hayati]
MPHKTTQSDMVYRSCCCEDAGDPEQSHTLDKGSVWQRRRGVFCLSVVAACLNGIAVGNLAGWAQAAIPQLLAGAPGRPALSPSETNWVACIFFLGMLGGGFTSFGIGSLFGKRKLFLFASVPLVLGWSVIAVAVNFWELVFGRIILGVGGGMICHQTEMYLSEISPSRLRSTMSVVFCVCVHTGVLLSFAVGPLLSISTATAIYLSFVLLLAASYLLVAPETPFWLARQGRLDEAYVSLKKLRGGADVHDEFEGIVEFVEKSLVSSKADGLWRNFARVISGAANRRAIMLVVLLTTVQQFSGMAALHSYAQLIFERSVSSSLVPGRYVSLMLGLLELVCTLGSGLVMERINRRVLVAGSSSVCAGCMALLGLYFRAEKMGDGDGLNGVLPLVCLLVFAVAYGLGLATLATVVAAECLSIDARSLGAAAQNTTVCFSIFTVTRLWQVISDGWGLEYSFWMAALITGAHTLVLLLILPETRGRSLVEIQVLLRNSSKKPSDAPTTELGSITIAPAHAARTAENLQLESEDGRLVS